MPKYSKYNTTNEVVHKFKTQILKHNKYKTTTKEVHKFKTQILKHNKYNTTSTTEVQHWCYRTGKTKVLDIGEMQYLILV